MCFPGKCACLLVYSQRKSEGKEERMRERKGGKRKRERLLVCDHSMYLVHSDANHSSPHHLPGARHKSPADKLLSISFVRRYSTVFFFYPDYEAAIPLRSSKENASMGIGGKNRREAKDIEVQAQEEKSR